MQPYLPTLHSLRDRVAALQDRMRISRAAEPCVDLEHENEDLAAILLATLDALIAKEEQANG